MIQDKIITYSIEELDISVRALNSLKQARIETIGELLELTIERCKELGFSNRTVLEIETVKDSFGIQINPLLHQYNNITEITALVKSIPNDIELGRAVRELFS